VTEPWTWYVSVSCRTSRCGTWSQTPDGQSSPQSQQTYHSTQTHTHTHWRTSMRHTHIHTWSVIASKSANVSLYTQTHTHTDGPHWYIHTDTISKCINNTDIHTYTYARTLAHTHTHTHDQLSPQSQQRYHSDTETHTQTDLTETYTQTWSVIASKCINNTDIHTHTLHISSSISETAFSILTRQEMMWSPLPKPRHVPDEAWSVWHFGMAVALAGPHANNLHRHTNTSLPNQQCQSSKINTSYDF